MPLIVKTTGIEEFLDPNGDSWVKTLIIGPPGSGKTPFAATFPKPFYIAAEDGLMSVAAKHVPYVRIRSTDDFDAATLHLRSACQAPPDKRKYQTVVVDTFDSFQKLAIQQRLQAERRENFIGTDWNWLGGRMDNAIARLMNLPMNVVVLLHDKDFRDDAGEDHQRRYKGNALKGDVKDSIYGQFDLIGSLEVYHKAVDGKKVAKRHIRWIANDTYPMLRDRSGQLPEFTEVTFEPTDFETIHDTVFGAATSLSASETVEEIEQANPDSGEVAPPDMQGGPVENPKTPGAPAKKATAKKTAAKKAAPAPDAPAVETTTSVPTGPQGGQAPHPTTDQSEAEKANAKATAEAPPEKPADGPKNESGTSIPQPVSAAAQKHTDTEVYKGTDEDGKDVYGPEDPTPEPTSSSPSSEDSPKPEPEAAAEQTLEGATELAKSELGATEVPEGVERANQTTGEIPPVETPAPAAAPDVVACGTPIADGVTPAWEGCGRNLREPGAPITTLQIGKLRTKAFLCDDCYANFKNAA